VDWLQLATRDDPDAPALVAGGRTMTFRELDEAATSAAAVLSRSGVGPGDFVAFPAEGTSTAVAAVWGIPRAGAAAVPLDPGLPPAEAMARTRTVGARAVWSPSGEGWRSRAGAFRPFAAGPPDPAGRYVVFTSGSGGSARGVVLTGATIGASVAASQRRLGNDSGDRWLCVLPLHHVGGLSILWRSARAGGVVVLEDGFEAGRAAALMRSGEVTMVSVVPTMLRRILDADPGPYRGLRAVVVGGGPADAGLLRRALEAGIPAVQTYGTTETASQIATTAPGEAGDHPESAGRALDGVEIRIVDGEGRPVGRGSEGRILVRGAVVSPGYVGEEARLPGSWLDTGDLGVLDREGRLTVRGRRDGVIVTGGENVSPAAVEAVLRDVPGVGDVRIRGEVDTEWGRAVVADVVLEGGTGLADVKDAARRRLAPHQVPKRWNPVDRIERGWKSGGPDRR
jgi:O-succinylbenzoic acid--CoA ligase